MSANRSHVRRLSWAALLYLALGWSAGSAPPPTVLVLEFEDRWSQATGAVLVCQQAGFAVRSQDILLPVSLSGVDLVLLGSFVSEHPSYTNFARQNRAQLLDFVREGGVLMQLTQADQTERAPPFLPERLQVRRVDPDFAALWIVGSGHPLLQDLPRLGDKLVIPTHLKRRPSWEGLTDQEGFQVLLASDPERSSYALLEAAHGRGRIIISSLFLDKLYRNGTLVAEADMAAVAGQFFANLRLYVEQVRAGTAPEVVPTRPPEPLPFLPGSWTLAVLPDTQNYSGPRPEIFEAQTRWIVENKQTRNIAFVLHLGDVVNNNASNQWENARRAMSILDGQVPYAIVPGNHDYGDNGRANTRQTFFSDYFPYSNYVHRPTFGGAMTEGRMENTYHLFRAGEQDWLVLALEWGPRDPVLDWANRIVAEHPQRKVILITHAYVYHDNTRYDWKAKGKAQLWSPYAYGTVEDPEGTNDGEDLWEKLVRKHSGFALVLSGHVLRDGLGRLSDRGEHNNLVHQMLVNYQMRVLGGEGYLRLLEFLPDGKTVQVKAYSPYLDQHLTDAQNQFVFKLDPPLPTHRNASSTPRLRSP